MAFQIRNYSTYTVKYGFQNFKHFFGDIFTTGTVFKSALNNTLIFFSANLFITIPLSILMCYFIYKKILGFKIFRFFFYLPNIIIGTVTVSLFKNVISSGGPIDALINALTGGSIPNLLSNSDNALKTIVFYTIFYSLGGNMILLGGAMNNIDASVIESAKIDGAGWARELLNIVLPLIWPTLSVMLLMVSVGLFTASGPILLFTQGSYNTYTISYWIYEQMMLGGNLELASAIGISLTVIAFPIVYLFKYLLNRTSDRIGV